MCENAPERFIPESPERTERNRAILSEVSRRVSTCDEHVVLDFDAVACQLPAGHDGMHEDVGDGGRIRWERA